MWAGASPGRGLRVLSLSVAGRTSDLYFESMARWLEIYFAELRQLAQAVLQSVTFSPKPIPPAK